MAGVMRIGMLAYLFPNPGQWGRLLSDWDNFSGATCPRCKHEAFWLRPSDGVCKPCAAEIEKKKEQDEKREAAIAKSVKMYGLRIKKIRTKKKAPEVQVQGPSTMPG